MGKKQKVLSVSIWWVIREHIRRHILTGKWRIRPFKFNWRFKRQRCLKYKTNNPSKKHWHSWEEIGLLWGFWSKNSTSFTTAFPLKTKIELTQPKRVVRVYKLLTSVIVLGFKTWKSNYVLSIFFIYKIKQRSLQNINTSIVVNNLTYGVGFIRI